MAEDIALVVLAKSPVPGKVKTRLSPPHSPEAAAALAEAALADTMEAVSATPVGRRVVVLDGDGGPWLPPGIEVIPQRGGGLDERLAAAFHDVAQPALLVGMDTPQVTPTLLASSVGVLDGAGIDAVLGLAPDGGYWAVGLRRPDEQVFLGVPMSSSLTGEAQLRRLRALGLRVADLPVLRDVDHDDDAKVVAATAPDSRFARALATLAAGTGRQVLVVDDDATVTEVLSRYLERAGYGVVVVGDGPSALRHVAVAHPDLVVLDLLLPGMHGMEVLRRLREDSPTPVIVLTALRAEMDRVAGLESGADDVLSKPFSPGELVARVGAVLRRSTPFTSDHGSLLCLGPFEVDLRSRIVRIGGDEVAMTARELDLLVFFLRHPRQVFGRDALLERVWGYTVGDTSTVTVHVRHVREKIELDPSSPQLLKTVWGVGYRFDPPAGGADADS